MTETSDNIYTDPKRPFFREGLANYGSPAEAATAIASGAFDLSQEYACEELAAALAEWVSQNCEPPFSADIDGIDDHLAAIEAESELARIGDTAELIAHAMLVQHKADLRTALETTTDNASAQG